MELAGRVKNVTKYGVFVHLGLDDKLIGLIHTSQVRLRQFLCLLVLCRD